MGHPAYIEDVIAAHLVPPVALPLRNTDVVMKYYILAGEASGDLHGSNLILRLREADPHAQIRCWGGDKMERAGAQLLRHYRDLAFMGFIEVVRNLPAILRNLRFAKKDILSFSPDVLVLIDYPGFNLRIASWAKKQGFHVAYYISPQVWAWKESRVKTIRRSVDRMLVILPFEKAFYARHKMEVDYVGHPLVEVVEAFRKQHTGVGKEKIIAVLPGSRRQEIAANLQLMLSVASRFPEHRFVVARAPSVPDSFYKELLDRYPGVSAVSDETYLLLMKAEAALVTSGTATLETALFGVPQVVCYKGSPVSYWIAKKLLTIKYICLVNLIMDRPVVPELIQKDFDAKNMERHLSSLLYDKDRRSQIVQHYAALHELLAAGGDASAHAARIISSLAASKKTTD
jgi:lipid-A-disaccharide synthase